MEVECTNCRRRWWIAQGHRPEDFFCGACGHPHLIPVQGQQQQNPALAVGGAMGGAAVGAAIGGPPGAVIGGLIGLFIGASAGRGQ